MGVWSFQDDGGCLAEPVQAGGVAPGARSTAPSRGLCEGDESVVGERLKNST